MLITEATVCIAVERVPLLTSLCAGRGVDVTITHTEENMSYVKLEQNWDETPLNDLWSIYDVMYNYNEALDNEG